MKRIERAIQIRRHAQRLKINLHRTQCTGYKFVPAPASKRPRDHNVLENGAEKKACPVHLVEQDGVSE